MTMNITDVVRLSDSLELQSNKIPNVANVEYIHEGGCVKLTFLNGTQVSIIRNQMSLGRESGLFEAAAWPDAEFSKATELKGWLTPEDVLEFVMKYAEKGAS